MENQSVGLEFYNQQKIFPVEQQISNLEKHFQVREALFRLLGVQPKFLEGKTILEVAAGLGQNALFLAAQGPAQFDICEPNHMAMEALKKNFKEAPVDCTEPTLFEEKFENFNSGRAYDFVTCEGWLGGMTEYERDLIHKLGHLLKIGGVLLISFYPPIGGLSSYLRRMLAFRLIDPKDSIEVQTEKLVEAFKSHLNTLPHMSRSHEHWVQDSLLNPHIYVGPLSPRMVFSTLGEKFTVSQSIPGFRQEWRWYKSLHGENRQFNEEFLKNYDEISHNLIDYRFQHPGRAAELNHALEDLSVKVIEAGAKYDTKGFQAYESEIAPHLAALVSNLAGLSKTEAYLGVKEAVDLLSRKAIQIQDVAQMSHFPAIFGREQCYLSLVREG